MEILIFFGVAIVAAGLFAFALQQWVEKRELKQDVKLLRKENDYLRSILGL